MNKPPTVTDIANEIARLKQQRPQLPVSTFGDDNSGACAAQIYTLEHRLSETGVFERYEGDPTSEEGAANADADAHLLSAALDAWRWSRGLSKDLPSDGWQPLVDRALGKFKKKS
jgi:hypothetical protein